jgi:carbonic anhydrase
MNAPIVGTTDHFDWESTKAVIHAPSEHTINGESYPLEMQIMHEINDLTMKREQAVYSILFEESEDEASALLESLIVGSDFRIDSLTGSD